MTSPRLKDASRNQLQRAQRLHRREQRLRHKQILAEGPQVLRELLHHRPELVRDLYVTKEAWDRHDDVRKVAGQAQVWTHVISAEDMRDLSSDGQGMVAVADMPEATNVHDVLRGARLVIATLAISDPGNLGTIIRSADAAGADAVLIGAGSTEAYSPKVIRSAAGSHFHLPLVQLNSSVGLGEGKNTLGSDSPTVGNNARAIVRVAHEEGLQVLAADGYGEWDLSVLAERVYEAQLLGTKVEGPDLSKPTLWLVGNEAHGFEGEDVSAADARVAIPLYGKAESLNVAVATSVCAYTTAMAQSGQGVSTSLTRK